MTASSVVPAWKASSTGALNSVLQASVPELLIALDRESPGFPASTGTWRARLRDQRAAELFTTATRPPPRPGRPGPDPAPARHANPGFTERITPPAPKISCSPAGSGVGYGECAS